ncbi:924_t:CDS:2 [Diversispora eburnea]|uniref:924_t:CDS:1 n=1 Tax=Diversispora eburnea TaxID=1213867 RepID=A0A9N8Z8C7_9GLOM|nr:924_t:CDS:2 [Diversispora eburnea]
MASVASRNLFDLLVDNEEDVESVMPEKETTREVVVQKKVDRSRASPKEARIRHEYPLRGGFKASPVNNRSEDTRSSGGDFPGRSSRGARTAERGRGGGRGGRRGREHDRHSSTGRFDSDKKETQAWGNPSTSWENNEQTESTVPDPNVTSSWGGNGTTENSGDATEAKSGWNADNETTTKSGWDAPDESPTSLEAAVGGGEIVPPADWEESKGEQPAWEAKEDETANEEPAPIVEEEVKTFDEYLAEKAQKSLDISLPEVRRANEGADDSQWKDAVPLEKDDEEDMLFAGKEHSTRLKSKKSKAKNYLEIEQTFIERSGAFPSLGAA